MRYVFVLQNGVAAPEFGALCGGDSVTILVNVSHDSVASSVERELPRLRAQAERLASSLSAKGVESKVVVEWGHAGKALENCLAREEAVQLK
ncbi:MAG: hypothetical protein V1708_03845 [Candidatus Micrarchaeota archaeon]